MIIAGSGGAFGEGGAGGRLLLALISFGGGATMGGLLSRGTCLVSKFVFL